MDNSGFSKVLNLFEGLFPRSGVFNCFEYLPWVESFKSWNLHPIDP